MSSAISMVLEQHAGEYIWFGAGLFTFKVTSEQSGGGFILAEDTMGRGKTTPLHVHRLHDETAYLIDGELLVHSREHRVGPGSVPDSTRHAACLCDIESARRSCSSRRAAERRRHFPHGGGP